MSEPNPADFLGDPLSDVTRKERRNLLLASVTGLLVETTGLVPTHISALGIEFSPPAQSAFVVLVTLTVVYFIGAFVIYGASDFFVWRKRYYDYLVAVEVESRNWSEEDQRHYDELHEDIRRIHWLYEWSKPLAFIRALFEFALPMVIGAASVSLLLFKVCRP